MADDSLGLTIAVDPRTCLRCQFTLEFKFGPKTQKASKLPIQNPLPENQFDQPLILAIA